MTTRKATHARLATVLEAIPNVGASIARDLRSIGIKQPQDLQSGLPHSDPVAAYFAFHIPHLLRRFLIYPFYFPSALPK